MTPYYFDLSTHIPFNKQDLVDVSCLNLLDSIDSDNFVQKDNYTTEVLNQDFLKYLEDKGVKVRKVVVWHWLASDPHIAHIDSGPDGDTVTAAINWTLTTGSQVNFYPAQESTHEVKYGNQDIPDWSTTNVGSYIPIDVQGEEPIAVWSSDGPCLINPAVPHMIVAKVPRISVSLQFEENIPFDELVEVFKNG